MWGRVDGVPKALLLNGNGRDALHTGNAKREGCVSQRALCVVCGASVVEGRHSLLLCGFSPGALCVGALEGLAGHTPLCLWALVGH